MLSFSPRYILALVGEVPVGTTVLLLAVQVGEVVPPFVPAHVQVQGPLPETADAVPVLQKLTLGATVKVPPLLLPHAPLTGDADAVWVNAFITTLEFADAMLTSCHVDPEELI